MNNNATKIVPDQETIDQELLDYDDDILASSGDGKHDCSSESDDSSASESESQSDRTPEGSGEDSSDDEEAEIARKAARYLALIKEEKRLKRNRTTVQAKKKNRVEKSQAWQLVEQFCNQEGYQIVRPQTSREDSREDSRGLAQAIRPRQSSHSLDNCKRKRGKSFCHPDQNVDEAMSEVTLYQRAVPSVASYPADSTGSNKRFNIKPVDYDDLRECVDKIHISSSSGDFVNTSDEIDNVVAKELPEHFIADSQMNDVPSTSKTPRVDLPMPEANNRDQHGDHLARAKLRETEAAKEATYQVPGELRKWAIGPEFNFDLSRDYTCIFSHG